jgi:hypothetical protein
MATIMATPCRFQPPKNVKARRGERAGHILMCDQRAAVRRSERSLKRLQERHNVHQTNPSSIEIDQRQKDVCPPGEAGQSGQDDHILVAHGDLPEAVSITLQPTSGSARFNRASNILQRGNIFALRHRAQLRGARVVRLWRGLGKEIYANVIWKTGKARRTGGPCYRCRTRSARGGDALGRRNV